MWDPEAKTLTPEFTNFFNSWKSQQHEPVTSHLLMTLPLEWSMAHRGCLRTDQKATFSNKVMAPNEQRAATATPPIMLPGLNCFLSIREHKLDAVIEMKLYATTEDSTLEDIFTVGITFVEYIRNKNAATAAQVYRVEKFWKLDEILKVGLIFGAQTKLDYLNYALESAQEEDKHFYGGMIRELMCRHRFSNHDYDYLRESWGECKWSIRFHCYVTEYPSRLEMVPGTANHTIEEGIGAVTLFADYRNMANGDVKRLRVRHDMDPMDPCILVMLGDRRASKSEGLKFRMRKYGKAGENLWEVEASVKIMLLSDEDFAFKIPCVLRWLKCAKTVEDREFLEELLVYLVGPEALPEMLEALLLREQMGDSEIKIDQNSTGDRELLPNMSRLSMSEQSHSGASSKKPKQCLIN